MNKPIIKKIINLENLNSLYEKEIKNLFNDDYIFNKKNILNTLKTIHNLDMENKYNKLNIRYKYLPSFYKEAVFILKTNQKQEILLNKLLFKKYYNKNFAKAHIFNCFIHEKIHKKQTDNFLYNQINNVTEKREIDKYLTFEFIFQNINESFQNTYNIKLAEILARVDTFNCYINLIKKDVVPATKENLIAGLIGVLQVYAMQYGTLDTSILLKNPTNIKLNTNTFVDFYKNCYETFYDKNELNTFKKEHDIKKLFKNFNKENTIEEINFDKFYYEFNKIAKDFESNVSYIYEIFAEKFNLKYENTNIISAIEEISSREIDTYLNYKLFAQNDSYYGYY